MTDRTEAARELALIERAHKYCTENQGPDYIPCLDDMADFAILFASEQSALDVAKAVREERERINKKLFELDWLDDEFRLRFIKELENENAG